MDEKLILRDNYFLVQGYLTHLQEKNRRPKSIRRYWFLLKHLLLFAMDVPFPAIHTIQPGLSRYVSKLDLSEESKRAIVVHSRSFLRWCKNYHVDQFVALPNFWIEDLTPVMVAARPEIDPVTESEIMQIARLKIAPANLALLRDQAAACLLFLSGIRGGALVTLPIQAVVLNSKDPHLLQFPDMGVRTKNQKKAKTFLYRVPELLEVVRKWDAIVRKRCDPHAPWYMPVTQQWGEQRLEQGNPVGENREAALNRRLRLLWNMLSLPHKSPQKFRHGCAMYGLRRCQTMEDYHHISRNLMHHDLTMTDGTYIHFEDQERGSAIRRISEAACPGDTVELQALFRSLEPNNLELAIEILAKKLASCLEKNRTSHIN